MLALDDPRWRQLDHRGWHGGSRYHLDPDAPFVPEELSKLLEAPSEVDRFRSLWPYLCSEGTTWAAAYAAVPYVVQVAAKLPPELRSEHLAFLGLVVIESCPERGESFEVKPYLRDDYHGALTRALPLLAETLVCPHDATETRFLLSSRSVEGASQAGWPPGQPGLRPDLSEMRHRVRGLGIAAVGALRNT